MRKLVLPFAVFASLLCGCSDQSVPTSPSNDEPSAQEKALFAKNGELVSTAGVRMMDLGPAYHTGPVQAINEPGTAVGSDGWGSACVWEKGERHHLDVYGWASGINNRGEIVGGSMTTSRGYLLSHGVFTDLGTLGGSYSSATAINDRGQVVGVSSLANGQSRAFLWDGGIMTDLGTLGGIASSAEAVNDRGQVVGHSFANPGTHPFLWDDGHMTDLGTLGGYWAHANAINNAGVIVGASQTVQPGVTHAFVWYRSEMTDLGTLGGQQSYAFGVNSSGQIVGDSDLSLADGEYHAVLWDKGETVDLGTLPGDVSSSAMSINDAGQVLGFSQDTDGNIRAVIWSP